MPKGKAGKKKKGTKLKIDEAALREMRMKQQTKTKHDLENKLDQELKFSRVNKLKIMNQWRTIMRLAKTESLKKDIEILAQCHERDVDRKDAILQMMSRDLEEAEDQYQMELSNHLTNVDKLIALHDSRLKTLEQYFRNELNSINDLYIADKELIINKLQQEKKTLTSIINSVEQEEKERESEIKQSFELIRDEIRNRNLEDINMLRIALDAQIEDLENQFDQAHMAYKQQTSQRSQDVKLLEMKDNQLSQQIDQRKKKVDFLQMSIQQWRSKSRQLSKEMEERNQLLVQEKSTIQQHYQQLKQRIQNYRSAQTERLLQLSLNATECKENLDVKLGIAKRILQESEMTRKEETIEEQLVPFGQIKDVKISNNEEDSTRDGKDYLNFSSKTKTYSIDGKEVALSDQLNNFHKKMNKVILDNIAIQKEKERLQEENGQLKDLIQQYVNGLNVNADILNEDNPLLVINGRSNISKPLPVRRKDVAAINGNMIMNSISRQLR